MSIFLSFKLTRYLRRLKKSGVLAWTEKLKEKYPQSEVYLVGGAVRDALLGKKDNKDYDFVVRGVSLENLESFLKPLGWVEFLGKSFGVFKFKPEKFADDSNFEPLDIALPRQEFSLLPGSYRAFEVKFDQNLNIEQDLSRRDFTVNAMAINLSQVETRLIASLRIVDPFNGLNDLKNKILRAVGEPEKRLSEDYTRILRAVRFACQLNFEIETETFSALKKLTPYLNSQDDEGEYIAPREIIAREFLKALDKNYWRAIQLCAEIGFFQTLMPELIFMKGCQQPPNFHTEGDVWTHTFLALKNLESKKFRKFEKKLDKILPITHYSLLITQKLELILATLLHDVGKPPTLQTPAKDGTDRIRFNDHDNAGAKIALEICERLKLSAPEKYGVSAENVSWLVQKHMVLIHGHPSELKPITVEKNFFNPLVPGKNLLKLSWLDISATITAKGPLNFDLLNAMLKRIKSMRNLVKQKKARELLPAHLLSGDEIMQLTKLEAGKKIGELKEKIREKQLSGEIKNKKEAQEFLASQDFKK